MALPFPGQDAVPFTTLTAQFYDETIANIESLAAGTGLDDGVVTPDKRSGGFVSGVIEQATLSTTGNKVVTGVGFMPVMVDFQVVPTSNAASMVLGMGSMTASTQYTTGISGSTSAASRYGSTNNCIVWVSAGSSTPSLLAQRVSLDADGFTINVTTASGAFSVYWKAYR